MSMNIDNPGKDDVAEALVRIGEANACVSLLAAFVKSEHFDMKKFGYSVGETLTIVDRHVSDAHLTLLNADITVNEAAA